MSITRYYAASLLHCFFWLIAYAAGRGMAISIFYIYYNIYKINNIYNIEIEIVTGANEAVK